MLNVIDSHIGTSCLLLILLAFSAAVLNFKAIGLVFFGLVPSIIFYYPISIKKDLTAVGFKHVFDGARGNECKKDRINRARRLRSIGNRIPPPFPNGWFAIIESHELKSGEAKSIDCLGKNLAVFRGEDQKVYVVDAYCPHMGANLGVGGTVHGDCLECPFHQWSFRGSDGECTNISYSTNPVMKVAKIKSYISREVNGIVFFWNHAEGADPWHIPVIQEIEEKLWVYHGRNEYYVNCHIQEIPENGADVNHLNAVHGPSILAGSDLRTTRSLWSSFVRHSWQATWQPTLIPHIAEMILNHSIRILNKCELFEMRIVTKQIGPGYVQLIFSTNYGPMAILQTVTPIEPLVQKVVHVFYGPRYMAPLVKFTLHGECTQFERDIMVWNSKKFVDNPILVKEDRQIKAFRAWYSQYYSENSLTFAASKESTEW